MSRPVSQCLDLNLFFLESVMLVGELGQGNDNEVVRQRVVGQVVFFLLCAKKLNYALTKAWKHRSALVTIHAITLTQGH